MFRAIICHIRLSRVRPVALFGCLLIVVITSPFYTQSALQKATGHAEGVILLTGFEPFGGLPINSSWEAVRQLDGRLFNGKRVVVVLLPVTWQEAGHRIQEAVARYQPELVISVGQGNRYLELDTYARNITGYIADNLGARPKGLFISDIGRMAYKTTLDLKAISRALELAGFSYITSPNSGTFLCNFVSYHTFAYLARVDPDIPVLFVHVPPLRSLATLADQAKVHLIARALTIIVDAANRQLVEENEANS
ncbi:MAG: pyroglutamyl-peptidase I [Aggregatilineales bacterium]